MPVHRSFTTPSWLGVSSSRGNASRLDIPALSLGWVPPFEEQRLEGLVGQGNRLQESRHAVSLCEGGENGEGRVFIPFG